SISSCMSPALFYQPLRAFSFCTDTSFPFFHSLFFWQVHALLSFSLAHSLLCLFASDIPHSRAHTHLIHTTHTHTHTHTHIHTLTHTHTLMAVLFFLTSLGMHLFNF